MAMTAPMQHLATYARLRPAMLADLDELVALHHSIAPQDDDLAAQWPDLIVSRGARVTLACEGGRIVGVAVELHRAHAAVARLTGLGVSRSARGRGIAHLLVDAVLTRARAEGAAILCADAPDDQPAMARVLEHAGFVVKGSAGGAVTRYARSLWNPRHSVAGNRAEPQLYPRRGEPASGVRALMVGMAALDRTIMLTPRLESVLGHESPDTGTANAAGLAMAAVRRGFRLVLQAADVGHGGAAIASALEAKQLVVADGLPTPEQMIGYLSRGHLPMIYGRMTRLHAVRRPAWVLLADFDGYLFRVVDPDLPAGGEPLTITVGELRNCLRAAAPHEATALVLLKPARP